MAKSALVVKRPTLRGRHDCGKISVLRKRGYSDGIPHDFTAHRLLFSVCLCAIPATSSGVALPCYGRRLAPALTMAVPLSMLYKVFAFPVSSSLLHDCPCSCSAPLSYATLSWIFCATRSAAEYGNRASFGAP